MNILGMMYMFNKYQMACVGNLEAGNHFFGIVDHEFLL